MKAVRIHRYGHSDQLLLEETDRPAIKDDEVLLHIRDAGVNPVDWKIREGFMKDVMPKTMPLTIGQDVAGEIAEAGRSVRDFKPGDAVFGFARGAYAEYAVASPAELARKPAVLDFEAAAGVPTTGLTAWQAVEELIRPTPGQRILIHGAAGGVGVFAVQFARLKGARITANAAARDADSLKSMGVELVIDHHAERFEDKGGDYDAVLDLVGGDTLARSYAVVKRGGIIVTTLGKVDEAQARERGLRAVALFMRRDGKGLAEIARLLDERAIKAHVGRVLPLSDARQAQDLSQNGRVHGKIVLRVS